MKLENTSLFNLIEIFGSPKKSIKNKTIRNCDEHYHHDYYCDSEKPFIAIQ